MQKAINVHQCKEIFISTRTRDMCNAGTIVGCITLELAQGSAWLPTLNSDAYMKLGHTLAIKYKELQKNCCLYGPPY